MTQSEHTLTSRAQPKLIFQSLLISIFMGPGGAGNLPVNFQKLVFDCQACHLPKKRISTHKIGGEVGLRSKMSDFSVQNINFIAKMTTIWSFKNIISYFTLIDYFVCNRRFALTIKKWVSTAKKQKPYFSSNRQKTYFL